MSFPSCSSFFRIFSIEQSTSLCVFWTISEGSAVACFRFNHLPTLFMVSEWPAHSRITDFVTSASTSTASAISPDSPTSNLIPSASSSMSTSTVSAGGNKLRRRLVTKMAYVPSSSRSSSSSGGAGAKSNQSRSGSKQTSSRIIRTFRYRRNSTIVSRR